MALIAVAADKGAPGVTTTATALAAVWPRPVVLAECDPAGGDIVYRLPGAHGGRLDPRRGLLSLAVAARHGLEPGQVWQHAQRLRGGLDVLAGVGNAEQGSGIEPLWGPVGDLLARLPGADVIADCGRLGPDGPYYELLARAAIVVLIIRPSLGEVLRLRDRAAAVAVAAGRRGGREASIGVLVIADRRGYRRALAEVRQAVGGANSPVGLVAGIAHEPKSAQRLRGEWGGRLDRTLLIRTARDAAAQLAGDWLPTAPPSGTRPVHAGLAGAGLAGAGSLAAGPASGAGPAGAARPAPGVRPADAGWESGTRPSWCSAVRGPGPARGCGPGQRAWAAHRRRDSGDEGLGTRSPGAGRPGQRAAGCRGTHGAAGHGLGRHRATHSRRAAGRGLGRRRGSVSRRAAGLGPGAAGPSPGGGPAPAALARPGLAGPGWPGSRSDLAGPGWPRLRADRGPGSRGPGGRRPAPTAAELTAAQVAAARLGPAEAAGGWPAAQSGPLPPSSAQPDRRRGAFRAGTGRGGGRGAGRGAGRGRHAGGPARPEADPGAAGPPGSGRARPRGW